MVEARPLETPDDVIVFDDEINFEDDAPQA